MVKTMYKKKPVIVDAVNLVRTQTSVTEVMDFMGKSKGRLDSQVASDKWDEYVSCILADEEGMIIETLEDGPNKQVKHFADWGDWIIKGVKGEFYPCKPDIFEETYEAVTAFTQTEDDVKNRWKNIIEADNEIAELERLAEIGRAVEWFFSIEAERRSMATESRGMGTVIAWDQDGLLEAYRQAKESEDEE